MDRLDLDQPRDLNALVSTALRTWWAHLAVFTALAALAVFPVSFLLDGLWAGKLADADATGSWQAQVGTNLAWIAVVGPLVTAMHVRVVLGLGRGEEPHFTRALVDGLRVLPWVIAAVLLYTLVIALGFVALIVPGVWLSVLCFFSAQAAVVEGERGLGALRHSARLVKGSWWRVFGTVIVLGLIAALLALPLGFATQLVGSLADNGPLYVLGGAIAQTVSLSFTALAGTLLFFDLRRRHAAGPVDAALAAPTSGPLLAPERP